ncbi:alpha/beta fold hydrolase [Streptomyces phyllanthi]|uniref:Alpha/beta hydrolase n=1 Tax=Streptomyces phyllanthi TaxID=1803180 RepID=A0A5N8WI58_9ACTN|nr:alpha/beta hydrolase [Streptomyces phyllanthi]
MTFSAPTTGHLTTPDGTHLAYRDHGTGTGTGNGGKGTGSGTGVRGARPPLLLLHGLAGHMGEWDDLLAPLLADGHRVVTYDARGHGASTRTPRDMTRSAAVRDTLALIEALDLAPVTLVGQSLGGHTALLTAASHPALVHSLVLIEAGPGGPNPALPSDIAGWLDSWPVPFPTPASATDFFGHEAWSRNLEQRPDGWYPRVDRSTTLAAIAELATTAYWPDWTRVTCPTLVVRGAKGTMPDPEVTDMLTRRPTTHLTTVAEAGHDVHLHQPERLYTALRSFFRTLETRV